METFNIRSGMMTQLPSPYRCIHLIQRSAGFSMDFHSHSFYHIAFVTSGELIVTFREKKHTVTQGQAILLPPLIAHELYSKNGYSQIGIDIFEAYDTRHVCNLLHDTFPSGFAVVTAITLPYSFEEMFKAMRNLTSFNTLKLLNAAEAFVITLLERANTSRNSCFREQVLDMLSKTGGLQLTLAQMHKQLNMSKTHFERLMRTEFDCGAVEYCKKLKLMKACLLLQDTESPIKEIAHALCFYDESHFANFFKKRTGQTPLQYRNATH